MSSTDCAACMDCEGSKSDIESIYKDALEFFNDEQSICPKHDGFVTLPAEIKQHILCDLPNVSSLQVVATTCSSFYDVFLGSESLIIGEVLLIQINPALLQTAVLILCSLSLEPWSKSKVQSLLMPLDSDKKLSLPPWTLRNALRISRLHEHIEFFAADFVSTTIAALPESPRATDLSALPLSSGESLRIQRAFYRFELFCNLFRERKKKGDERFASLELRDHFFARFLPCENEQLACVYEYLWRKLSICMYNIYSVSLPPAKHIHAIAYNDVTEHDIDWAKWEFDPVEESDITEDNYSMEHYLSKGLAYIRRVITVKTYDECHDLLKLKSRVSNRLYVGWSVILGGG